MTGDLGLMWRYTEDGSLAPQPVPTPEKVEAEKAKEKEQKKEFEGELFVLRVSKVKKSEKSV